ncbi:MAG: indole-3-glycerol-phosphate synthase, partial [Methanoregula sp.]|nr:indole-3-glycerol-phosphate synthase [Methanoregula sp.]
MILDSIISETRKRVDLLPATFPENSHDTHASLSRVIRSARGKNAIIAELKCASPTQGTIRSDVDLASMAKSFVSAGCIALSILTEPHFFSGSVRDIPLVKDVVGVPVLRKDFIIDRRQIAETRALGADSVLLIAAVLGGRLPEFVDDAFDEGLEPLVEVHTPVDVEIARSTRADIIGINNRDLSTFAVDLSTTRILSPLVRSAGRIVVCESGIASAGDVRNLRPFCDAFLIGTSIMAHDTPEKKLEEFV